MKALNNKEKLTYLYSKNNDLHKFKNIIESYFNKSGYQKVDSILKDNYTFVLYLEESARLTLQVLNLDGDYIEIVRRSKGGSYIIFSFAKAGEKATRVYEFNYESEWHYEANEVSQMMKSYKYLFEHIFSSYGIPDEVQEINKPDSYYFNVVNTINGNHVDNSKYQNVINKLDEIKSIIDR